MQEDNAGKSEGIEIDLDELEQVGIEGGDEAMIAHLISKGVDIVYVGGTEEWEQFKQVIDNPLDL